MRTEYLVQRKEEDIAENGGGYCGKWAKRIRTVENPSVVNIEWHRNYFVCPCVRYQSTLYIYKASISINQDIHSLRESRCVSLFVLQCIFQLTLCRSEWKIHRCEKQKHRFPWSHMWIIILNEIGSFSTNGNHYLHSSYRIMNICITEDFALDKWKIEVSNATMDIHDTKLSKMNPIDFFHKHGHLFS